MKCPVDNTDLLMAERQGIEIDYCPECRGVWLDRGELDKIIERSEAAWPHRNEAPASDHPDRQNDPRDGNRQPYMLGDMFDFGS